MWVRGVCAMMMLGIWLPSLAMAQSGIFRASFTETTESLPTGLTVGDFDQDGLLDLAVTTPDTRVGSMITSAVTILKGVGGGEFFIETKIVVSGYPAAILRAPLDADAIPDLIVADGNGGSIAFMKGLGNGDFFAPPGSPTVVGSLPEDIAAANLNDDGILDLVVANRESSSGNLPGSVSILQGQGDGTFVTVLQHDPTPEEPNRLVSALSTDVDTTAVALGDLNDDGFVDIAALNSGISTGTITIFFGDGDLNFGNRTTVPVGRGPSDIALNDLDGDGSLDAVIAESFADTDGAVAVLLGNGDGTFQEAQSLQAGNTPNGIAVADMSGDAVPDIVASNSRSGDVSVLLGNGSGGFAEARTFVADAEPISLALADMDNDGATDVVAITAAESGTAVLARNRGDGSLDAVEDVLVGLSPSAIASGDVNDDAMPDLLVGTSTGELLIYSPQVQGGFRLIQSLPIGGLLRSIAAVDLDGDAVLDLAVADEEGNRAVILKGLGGAHFGTPASVELEPRPSAITSGDFNGDGRVDLAVASSGPKDVAPPLPKVTALLRQANGSYVAGMSVDVEDTPSAVVAADFDGNGRDDLAVANQGADTISVLLSNANGSLRLSQTLNPSVVGQQPSSLTVADFNLDGRPDIAAADFLGGVSPSTIKLFLTGEDGLLAFDRSLNAGTALEDIVARDFTGDSLADLAVVVNTANQVTLFYDQGNPPGDRRFRSRPADNVSRQPINVTVADFNDDGRYDIATGNKDASANNVSVLTNCIREQECSSLAGVTALRGDGNDDTILSAADLVAVSLEVADADGKRVEDIARPEAAGFQAAPGVDANGDGRVDRQDRTAVVTRLFRS